MGVWHRYNAVSWNCDCDVMWVAIPMLSALPPPPPLPPLPPPLPLLRRPTAAHHTLTSGYPPSGAGGRGHDQEPCTQVRGDKGNAGE